MIIRIHRRVWVVLDLAIGAVNDRPYSFACEALPIKAVQIVRIAWVVEGGSLADHRWWVDGGWVVDEWWVDEWWMGGG